MQLFRTFRKYRWKSPYVSNDCLWKICLYLDFLTDFLVDIYEIFSINNSSNLDYLMWFKEGISLDDSNFDMENYSSLVDVKLLLKRILGGHWNKLLCKKIIESKVQLVPPTENVIMAVLTLKSVIQLTAFKAFETRRNLNSVCCILLLVPLQTYIWQIKNWALLADLLKVKNNMFLPDNCHTQKRTYSLNTHP